MACARLTKDDFYGIFKVMMKMKKLYWMLFIILIGGMFFLSVVTLDYKAFAFVEVTPHVVDDDDDEILDDDDDIPPPPGERDIDWHKIQTTLQGFTDLVVKKIKETWGRLTGGLEDVSIKGL